MATATSCMACGTEGAPCCVDKTGAPTPNFCGTDKTLMCVDHMCTKSNGKFHEACSADVKCDVADYPGLQCVAPPAGTPGAPEKWCDCGDATSAWKLCKDTSVCAPSGPVPTPSGDVPNCSTLLPPAYLKFDVCSKDPKDHKNGYAGAGNVSKGATQVTCDVKNDDQGKAYIAGLNQDLCKWDIPP